MDEDIQKVYLIEARTQCQFAINAVGVLNSLLSKWEEARRSENGDMQAAIHQEMFRTIHSLMTHASNISKLFWPAAPPHRRNETEADYQSRCSTSPRLIRAIELRALLDLPEDGHALKSRKLRDHLEHYDERLDQWQTTSFRKNFFHDSIGSREMLAGVDDVDIMRWFDPVKKLMLFRGESFNLQEIVDGIGDILTKLEKQGTAP